MRAPRHDNGPNPGQEVGVGSQPNNAAVISWLDDVLYPSEMYRKSACRTAAALMKRLFGIEAYESLFIRYVQGQEHELAASVLQEHMDCVDPRHVRKVAEAMSRHNPKVAPYEDSMETFAILGAMGIPLGLIGEGPVPGQRLVAERLHAGRLFNHVLYTDPCSNPYGWQDALVMLEVLMGVPLDQAVMVCADQVRANALAKNGWRVYYLSRLPGTFVQSGESARLVPMINLYELPEALGFFASR